MTRGIPDALVATIESAYGCGIGSTSPIEASDEAVAWRAAADRPLFIHQSPPWRTREEISWVHELVRRVAPSLPEAVAPLRTLAGATYVEYESSLITLYPLIEGAHLDRDDARQRDAAARLLARVHRALLRCEMPPRPLAAPPSSWRAVLSQPVAAEPEQLVAAHTLLSEGSAAQLVDDDLDRWHAALRQRTDLRRGLVHGDYYRRNLLWADGRVVGVVDWHEAHHDVVLAEIAHAAWEFSKSSDSRSFSADRAIAFLDAYTEAGGVDDVRERSLIIPLIRWRLREEALLSLALEARHHPGDLAYRQAITASFTSLRGGSL